MRFDLKGRGQRWRKGLALVLVLSCSGLWGQKIDPYADSPNWYKPGHPLTPAEATGIEVREGFVVEKLLTIPSEIGSVSAMTTDPQGNLVIAMQHRQGVYRVPLASLASEEGARLEPLGGAAMEIGSIHGLLWAFDSLYVTVAEKNDSNPMGLYRLLDINGDGVFDETRTLFSFRGSGEHGPHGLTVGPDGESIYMMCGNGTPVPEGVDRRSAPETKGPDHLMAPGFENSEYTDAGWVFRFDPDGSNPELIVSGLRNSYDLAFNKDGELFTCDSDMEYDLGSPWYRPTRVCHLTRGAHFGWRSKAAKWPEWYEDSLAPVVNIGPGSPTGLVFGYDARFPDKYRNALFVLDWTYATLYAVHLKAEGASYAASVEPFVSGLGLPLTDAVVGGDGALYFSVGGRRLGSAIYRVSYEGPLANAEGSGVAVDEDARSARALRKELEQYQGASVEGAVDRLWPYLKSPDRRLRYAARVALESQPLSIWKKRALSEKDVLLRLNALLALARQGEANDLPVLVDRLNELRLSALPEESSLLALRTYEVALARGGALAEGKKTAIAKALRPAFPQPSPVVNRELARILCAIGDRSIIDPVLGYMEGLKETWRVEGHGLVGRNPKYASPLLGMVESPPLVERMHYAQMLNGIEEGWTYEQNRRRFRLIVDAMQHSKGGIGYVPYWTKVLDMAKSSLSETELERFADLWAPLDRTEPLPKPEGPGRIWELDYWVRRLEEGIGRRDFEKGKRSYAAASCVSCHSIGGAGGALGPDLTTLGQRFTVKDLLESIIDPSKAISDQYQAMVFTLKSGEVLSGRVVSKDSRKTVVATNALDPSQTRALRESEIETVSPVAASSMPAGLLNALNENEVLDLIAYLLAGGNPEHPLYERE